MSDRVRRKDFVIEVTTATMSGQPTPLGRHEPSRMTISLPRVRFLDEEAKDTPTPENTAPRLRRSVDRSRSP